jgi:membrane protein DedA with SNARE-associated domain
MFNNRVQTAAVASVGVAAMLTAIWLGGHFALFAWIVASGLGVPPGEDLLIAGIGALVTTGDLTRWVAIPMAIVAVVTSDTLLFTGGQVARSVVTPGTTWWSSRAARYIDTLVGRREGLAIAVARFVPGIRTLVFVSVGARGLSRGRFVLVDACAAAVWAPLVMTSGAALITLVLGEGALSFGAWI